VYARITCACLRRCAAVQIGSDEARVRPGQGDGEGAHRETVTECVECLRAVRACMCDV
jgi:hypothetical protein